MTRQVPLAMAVLVEPVDYASKPDVKMAERTEVDFSPRPGSLAWQEVPSVAVSQLASGRWNREMDPEIFASVDRELSPLSM